MLIAKYTEPSILGLIRICNCVSRRFVLIIGGFINHALIGHFRENTLSFFYINMGCSYREASHINIKSGKITTRYIVSYSSMSLHR